MALFFIDDIKRGVRMLKLEIDEKFEELSNLYDLFENITRIDYVPLEYREEIKQLLIKAYKDGNQEFEKIHEKLKRLEHLEKENENLKLENFIKHLVLNREIDKLKKAIEILKDKYDFDIYYNENFTTPTVTVNCDYFKELTQQEYELLKEVLGNDD